MLCNEGALEMRLAAMPAELLGGGDFADEFFVGLVGQRRGKCPVHTALFIAIDKRVVRHYRSTLEIQAKRHLPESYPYHGVTHSRLVLLFAKQQQKSTASRPGDFASKSPILAGHGVDLVDPRSRNMR